MTSLAATNPKLTDNGTLPKWIKDAQDAGVQLDLYDEKGIVKKEEDIQLPVLVARISRHANSRVV